MTQGDDIAPNGKLPFVKHQRNQFGMNVVFGKEGARRRDAKS
jgi:hypothetical protein